MIQEQPGASMSRLITVFRVTAISRNKLPRIRRTLSLLCRSCVMDVIKITLHWMDGCTVPWLPVSACCVMSHTKQTTNLCLVNRYLSCAISVTNPRRSSPLPITRTSHTRIVPIVMTAIQARAGCSSNRTSSRPMRGWIISVKILLPSRCTRLLTAGVLLAGCVASK